MSENEEFIREFLDECEENLDQLDQDLIALEKNPHDSSRLESIFRTIHTIKGTSGFFAFAKLGALAHDGESLLGRLRDGELTLNQEMASTLLQLIDAVREMLASIRDSGNEGAASYQGLSANLIRLALSSGGEPATPISESGEASLEAASESGADVKTESDQNDEAIQNDAQPVEAQDVLSVPGDLPKAVPGDLERAGGTGATGDVNLERTESPDVDQLSADLFASDDAAISRPEPQSESESVAPTVATVDDSHTGDTGSQIAVPASEGSIRVDVRLLDGLMDLAGELVLARNQLNQFSSALEDTALVKTIQRLSSITSEMQQGVMQTRMQPISTIWGKFPRVVRDLAVACGKEIALEQEGADTELDRSLLEAIKDPLTHLLRNAVDHGIELPAARESRGKPRQGRVLLRAYHEGGQVNIEIIDDGGGIDVRAVKKRALQRSLIDPQQAAMISDHELVQLIFRPGFSTAEKVTDVSGRGVGMDVVRTNIERIGGAINLQNRPGLGTTIRITIPLTLAIIPALIVTAGHDQFAIPQVSLVELLNCGNDVSGKIEWVSDAPVYRLRGNLLPLIYLSQILNLDHQSNRNRESSKIVVLQAEGCRFGLVVDQVINTQEIVVKPLGQVLQSIPLLAGATIMGDGAVVLILDVVGMARSAGLKLTKPDLAIAEDEPGQPTTTAQPFLICEGPEGSRVAIRLGEVHRLEEFPVDSVQRSASMEAVEYDGKIMPLVRLSKLLGWAELEKQGTKALNVVVHRELGSNAGLVVPGIVDIEQCTHEIQRRSDQSALVIGWTLIQSRVTDVIDLPLVLRMAGARRAQQVGDAT